MWITTIPLTWRLVARAKDGWSDVLCVSWQLNSYTGKCTGKRSPCWARSIITLEWCHWTWTIVSKPNLLICFFQWVAGRVRWGEGSTNAVQEDKTINFVGLYLCFHLGTHFLLFKCHSNSWEHKFIPPKRTHMVQFSNKHRLWSPQKQLQVTFLFSPKVLY